MSRSERSSKAPLAASPNCLSCGGSGWATIRRGGITYATGACRCIGGNVWRNPIRENVENVTREARDGTGRRL